MELSRTVPIVVVDDDEGHAELISINLRRSGISNPIIVLHDGTEALEYVFRRGVYSDRTGDTELLVLLDINMPGLAGTEVLHQLKTHDETKSIPIVMLTTTDDSREVNRCYELGCNVYLTKPVDHVAFTESIRRLGLFISVWRMPVDTQRICWHT